MIVHRQLVRLGGAVAWPVAGCAALGVAVSAAYVGQALLLASALAAVARRDLDAAPPLLAGVLAVIVFRAGLLWWREVATAAAGARIRARLRDRLVGRLAELGPAWLTGARTGRTQATLVDGVEGLDAYYSRYVPQVLVTATVPTVLVAWLATVEPVAAALLGVAVLLVLTVPRAWDATLLRRGRGRWAAFTALAADFLDTLQGAATLRAFGAVGRMRDRVEVRSRDLHATTMAQLRLSLVEGGVSALLVHAGVAAATVAAAVAATGGRAGAATVFLVLLISAECFRPVRDLGAHWHAGYLGVTAVDGLTELLTARPPVVHTGRVDRRFAAGPAVVFERVGYRYPDRARPAVRDVTLRLAPGETVAVVGRSGAGKSTLANLLLRHLDPDAGRITVDGVDLRDLTRDALRRTITVVAQETYLFHGTVADNLRLARPDATDADLVAAARAAGAHDFVTALPNGYATPVGERGATLSGGQRQRLAIARAMLADTPVLILDEATSHLDRRQEAEILTALAGAARGRTCLVIAHRLAGVRHADRIALMCDGRITATGRHEELLRTSRAYADLVTVQEEA
ncbi:ABC-type transport system involved in cytochrome bd biosynthesis, ATPase and permease components [Micromonospora citrea]|uniref:ABC-type transport system involved in cytochrome bd biosynthesis, ATPase and permease components n=1 Tax=Micromonospora citrea TaxID=47855 RepID=A0A1C6VY25_9ACTN|nr:ATP-binding cassette domain-containing protein [Micromonospora citrea]SCL71239.1 ABC-type transport system involved in cytochrome bd biosynthesis, ATPase and permease components [Micromonospora citrea]